MKKEHNKEQENIQHTKNNDEHHIDPFNKTLNSTKDKETLEEQSAAEQQRKEVLTERD